MAAYELLLLNTSIPQIQAAQSGDTYVVPRDIAFSAALTLSAGTANGVPYLNGSKVLTTGSALTFDGTKLNAASSVDGPVSLFGVSNATTGGGSTLNIAAASTEYAFSSVRGDTVLRSESNSLVFGTASEFKWGSTGAEWMRLTSTGLGIGTNNPGTKLHVASAGTTAIQVQNTASTGAAYLKSTNTATTCNFGVDSIGGYIETLGAYGTLFYTNGTERARITSDGNFLVGGVTDNSTGNPFVTSTGIGFVAGASTPQINYYSSASTIEYVNRDSGGSKTFSWYYQASASGSPATLSTSGVWTNASDARGKENIEDINYGLAQVLALQPRQYDVKSDNSHAVGFVAQEVQPLIPELVHVTRRDENDEYYGLDYGSMTAVLVKAIQEQQAMINELKAEVAALKGA